MRYLILSVLMALPLVGSCQKKKADPKPTQQPVQPAGAARRPNPIVTSIFTADPGAMVHDGKMYIYAGRDEQAEGKEGYVMRNWEVFSSTDMLTWERHPQPLNVAAFSWAKGDAWASQVIERDGKFYWYVCAEHKTVPGKALGVAVSNSPIGPFTDARGTALVTNDLTPEWNRTHPNMFWDDIDPSVFIDGDGQAYLFWGNSQAYYAKLKPNMTELDGPIMNISLPSFTEAPWVHKRGDWYYLSYASGWPEQISYAMSKSINGPWEPKGVLNDYAENSTTNHQAILDFKGKTYFVYHNGALPTGGNFRRSVCVDYLEYNPDGTMKKVVMTKAGVSKVE